MPAPVAGRTKSGPRGGWLLALLLACASSDGASDARPAPQPTESAGAPQARDSRDASFQLFPHDPELSAFLMAYPRAPDAAAALDRLVALDLARFEQGARERQQWPLARALLIEFYATLIRGDPGRASALARRMADVSIEKAALCQELLDRAAAAPVEVAVPMVDAAWLDLLWARYYASGDREQVRRIAQSLEYARPAEEAQRRMRELARSEPGTPENAELQRLLVAHAAVFGLMRHGAVDPGVRAVLRELAREPGHAGEVSAALVASLETPQVPAWERAPGFQAAAFLTPDPQGFVARMSARASGPLPLTNHTSPGSVVHVLIWLSDCAAGGDGTCRAVADFLVYAPDGSVYAKSELDMWVARPPAEGTIQLGHKSFGLLLPKQAKPGRYRIHVVVRDEVADQARESTLDLFLEES